MIINQQNWQQYFFLFLLILNCVDCKSTLKRSVLSQKDPVYDIELSTRVHLKWQLDYDNGEVTFEVAFSDENQGRFQGIQYFLMKLVIVGQNTLTLPPLRWFKWSY